MKLISVREASTKWMNALKNRQLGTLRLYTFKKDRYVQIEKIGDCCRLSEAGYLTRNVELDPANAKKELKEAFAREFPRSTRLYIHEDKGLSNR